MRIAGSNKIQFDYSVDVNYFSRAPKGALFMPGFLVIYNALDLFDAHSILRDVVTSMRAIKKSAH